LKRERKKDIKGAGAYVLIKGHKCHRCGHEWRPKDIDVVPVACPNPKCHSPYWDRPRRESQDNVKA